jgi:hypothetical protein
MELKTLRLEKKIQGISYSINVTVTVVGPPPLGIG